MPIVVRCNTEQVKFACVGFTVFFTGRETKVIHDARGSRLVGSGVVGKGINFREKYAEFDKKESALARIESKNRPRIEELQQAARSNADRRDARAVQRKAELIERSGFLGRYEALSKLADKHATVRRASRLITLLIVLLEVSPIVVKLLAARGPYDEVLDTFEHRAAVRKHSRRESSAEIAVSDVQQRLAFHREFLTFQSEQFREAVARARNEGGLTSALGALATSLIERLRERGQDAIHELSDPSEPVVATAARASAPPGTAAAERVEIPEPQSYRVAGAGLIDAEVVTQPTNPEKPVRTIASFKRRLREKVEEKMVGIMITIASIPFQFMVAFLWLRYSDGQFTPVTTFGQILSMFTVNGLVNLGLPGRLRHKEAGE